MRRFLSICAAALVLAGCSSSADGPTQNTSPGITISAGSASLTVARGETVAATVAVTRTQFSGTVTLGTQNLPAGVTVTFAPATLASGATTATASLTVTGTAVPGTYTFSLTATGSGVSNATFPVTLTIPTPSIALTALNTGTIVQGQFTTLPITITRGGGYTDAVTLAISGLPAGVTHAFAPATIGAGATTSTLTLTATQTATLGTVPVTITATGTGVTAQTATVNLTVVAAATPTIALAAAPAAVTAQAGQNATSTITLTRSGGFAGDVALAVSGAPTGVTPTFSAPTLAGAATTSTLTLAIAANAAAGQYNVTITGSGTGVANATAVVTLTVTAAPTVTLTPIAAQSLSQGTSSAQAIAIIITRSGVGGDAVMTLEGAPAGVSATFAPPQAGVTTQMTLAVAANTVPGVYPLTVRATVGAVSGTAAFNLTVTAAAAGSFAMNVIPAASSVQQGQTALATINIARAGGFTGAITLSATGQPAGVQVNFVPNPAAGTQSQLGIDVGGAVVPGTYPITIRGQGAGVTAQEVVYTLTVTAAGGGSGNVIWEFCEVDRYPVWFAAQNGNGAWTPVTSSVVAGRRRYTFTITAQGGVAYAIPRSGGGTDVTVIYGTSAEQGNSGAQECTPSSAGLTLNGSVAGLTQTPPFTSQSATINVGDASQSVAANGSFVLNNAPNGLADLLAIRTTTTIGMSGVAIAPDRAILRRAVNYTNNIPLLDFSAEGFAPATAQLTIGNLGGDQLQSAITTFQTSRGSAGSFATFAAALASPVTVYGVPAGQLQAGDLHGVILSASGGTAPVTNTRSLFQYNQQLTNRTITLGPTMTAPTITTDAAPYRRFNATGPWQAEYADAVGISYFDTAANGDSWTLTMSRAYAGAGAANWTLTMPDFSGVAGFNTAWALSTSMNWSATVSGQSGFAGGTPSEGAQLRTASRTGTAPM